MSGNQQVFYSASGKRTILVADDEAVNREILHVILENEYDLLFAQDGQGAFDLLQEYRDTLSLVLLDLKMPCMSGQEFLRRKKADPLLQAIPVIVLTTDQEAEVESLRLGAIDFIPKPYPKPDVILARVQRTIELSEDRNLIRLTEHDPLTGLYNREYFYSYAEQFDLHNKGTDMDAMVIDVDHFHLINERCGKAWGDGLLRRIGAQAREAVQAQGGIVCRREADTFLVYCPHREDYEALLAAVSQGLTGAGDAAASRVRLRMGVYSRVDKGLEMERRFDRAKLAADTIRNNYSRPVAMYDDALHQSELYDAQLTDDFYDAIARKQFLVYYQPKFDVRGETPLLSSAEALVRWQHPKLGLISPSAFIPLFEENGMISTLNHYVWRAAAAQVRDWKQRFGVALPVSVNVSRTDMLNDSLPDVISGIVQEFGISPCDYMLEITESAYTDDSDHIIDTVKQLRTRGFRIEMDDFGTGYSSLAMLSKLPLDVIKLDMSFVRHAFGEPRDVRMLELILGIAGHLGVPVVAEGVETAEQARGLKALGCEIIQGFYFSRPLPADQFDRLVAERAQAHTAAPSVFSKQSAEGSAGLFKNVSAAALHSFEALYIVDTETGAYAEFGSRNEAGWPRPVDGKDFFAGLEAGLLSRVLPQDQEKAAACRREALLAQTVRDGAFSAAFRVQAGDEVRHYRLHAACARGADDRRVIVCLEDADFQLRREAAFDQARAESLTYTMIAQALAKDYASIYLVDMQTEDFIEYSIRADRQELRVEQRGCGFFETYRQRLLHETYAPDLEKALTIWDKKRMAPLLAEGKTLSAVFRMLVDGAPAYIRCKINRMTDDGDDRHIVVGMSNVDAQMKRQQELELAREAANRDALTGVKSKHAFAEAEQHWNALLSRGDKIAFGVAVCDVNGLKAVNDTKGHKAGDAFIREASAVICGIFKHSPVYRVGGDEFVVILSGRDYENRESMRSQMEFVNLSHSKNGGVTIACGMAALEPERDVSFEAVFERADREMYKNKRNWRAAQQ